MQRQPALKAGIAFGLGIIGGSYLRPPLLPLFSALVILSLLSIFAHFRRSNLLTPLIFVTLMAGGATRYGVKAWLLPSHHISRVIGSGWVTLEGQVSSDPDFDDQRTRFKLKSERIHFRGRGISTRGGILVKATIPPQLVHYGNRLELQGWLSEPPSAANPGQFDYRNYLHQHGTYKLMTIRNPSRVKLLGQGGNPIRYHILSPLRRFLLSSIDSHLRGDPAHLLKGILLGERKGLSKRVQRAFADAGVIHVLAVSGLHVGLVITIFLTLFRALRLGFRPSSLATILVLAAYCGVAQFRPSVVRSTIMGALILWGLCMQRKTDLLNSIGAAGLLILLLNPLSIFDIGFQLSFVATISIVYLYPRLRELSPRPMREGGTLRRWLWGSLLVSLSAQLGIIPLLISHFHRVPLISPLSNLLIVPLVGVSLALGLTSSVTSILSLKLGYIFSAADWLFLKLILWLTALLSHIPCSSISVPHPPPVVISFYYLFLIPLVHIKSSLKARRALLVLTLILANLLSWKGALKGKDSFKVTFLALGEGSSAVIQLPRGVTIVVDGGGVKRGFNFGERVVIPYLQSIGKRRIDLLVVSSPSPGNLASLIPILREYRPKGVMAQGATLSSPAYLDFIQELKGRAIPYLSLQERFTLNSPGGVRMEFLPSSPGLAMRLTYGRMSLLLLGEMRNLAQHKPTDIASRIIWTANPGELTKPLLREVNPQLAIVSSLSPEERERITELGITPLSLKREGAITIITNGKKWELRKYLTKGK